MRPTSAVRAAPAVGHLAHTAGECARTTTSIAGLTLVAMSRIGPEADVQSLSPPVWIPAFVDEQDDRTDPGL